MKRLRLPISSMLYKIVALTFLFFGSHTGVYPQNSIYSDPFLISLDTNMIATMAASALDKVGNLHIAYVGWYAEEGAPDGVASEIFYTNNIGGAFKVPEKLPEAQLPFKPSFEDDYYYSKEPSIAVDSHGGVHIAYYRAELQLQGTSHICYTNNRTGSFAIPKVIYYDPLVWNTEYSNLGNNIMLAADPENDSIHIVFTGNSGTGHGGIRYSGGLNGKFRPPFTITTKSDRGTIRFDNEGVPNIVYWIRSDTTSSWSKLNLVTSKIVGGRFTKPILLYESKGTFSSESNFTFDKDDSIHVVFRNNSIEFGVYNMFYVAGKNGLHTMAKEIYTNTIVSLMYGIEIGKDQEKYIAYKQAAGLQSLGLMANTGSGFKDFSPDDYYKYGIISASPQWFSMDKDKKTAYFVYTTGQIYLVTADLDIPSAPKNMYPSNHAGNIEVKPTIRWNPPSRASLYNLQVSTLVNFSTLVINQRNISDTAFTVSGLYSGMTYYWRVSAEGAGGTSDWSEIWEFNTKTQVGINGLSDEECRVFPNPVGKLLYIDGFERENVNVSIFSIDGRLLKQFTGINLSQINLSDLQKGTYLLRVSNSKLVFTNKIVKQ